MYALNESGDGIQRLLSVIKKAGYNTEVRFLRGEVTSGPPFSFKFAELDIEIEGDIVTILPSLLPSEEYVTLIVDGEQKQAVIQRDGSLHVGVGVLALFDEDNGEFYVIATL